MIDDDIDDQYFYKDIFLELSKDLEFECVSDFRSLCERYFSDDLGDIDIPGLIILDLNLPKVSGKDIYKELKKNTRLKCVPVVVLTTSDSPMDMQDCKDMGVTSYFVKPIEYERCKILSETILNFYFEFNALNKL